MVTLLLSDTGSSAHGGMLFLQLLPGLAPLLQGIPIFVGTVDLVGPAPPPPVVGTGSRVILGFLPFCFSATG
jgi:hypothetical protein